MHIVVTSFDVSHLKTPHSTQTWQLYLLQNWSYCRLKFYIMWTRNFTLFSHCDLDDSDLQIQTWPVSPKSISQIKNELSTSRLSKVIVSHTHTQTDRHTDVRKRNYYHATLWVVYLLPCHFVGGNEVQTVKVIKSHRELTGCMYCAGTPTAFTRPDCAATVLAAAPAPDDFRRFDRGLCVRPAGRNSACGSCSFGSIIGGGCSSILLSCDQHENQPLQRNCTTLCII